MNSSTLDSLLSCLLLLTLSSYHNFTTFLGYSLDEPVLNSWQDKDFSVHHHSVIHPSIHLVLALFSPGVS